MRICVFGAGAIGGYLAGHLAQSGTPTSLIARGAHLAAIQANGLRVAMPGRTIHVTLPAESDPARLGPQDAVIVTVKAPALPAVARGIAPLLGPDTAVAFVTNGIPWWYFHRHGGPHDGQRIPRLDPAGDLWDHVGPERAIGGIAWPASSVPEPGVIRMISGETLGTTFGEPDGSSSPRLNRLADAFRAAGLPVSTSDRIRDLIWQKLIFNLSAGPLCVLTSAPVLDTQKEPDLVAASRVMLAEAEAVARAMGGNPTVEVDRILATNQRLTHRPSILQDLQASRPMEIDALYGVFQDFARMTNTPTPTLDLIFALIRVRARAGGLYDS